VREGSGREGVSDGRAAVSVVRRRGIIVRNFIVLSWVVWCWGFFGEVLDAGSSGDVGMGGDVVIVVVVLVVPRP
jgi:hypothetical protein